MAKVSKVSISKRQLSKQFQSTAFHYMVKYSLWPSDWPHHYCVKKEDIASVLEAVLGRPSDGQNKYEYYINMMKVGSPPADISNLKSRQKWVLERAQERGAAKHKRKEAKRQKRLERRLSRWDSTKFDADHFKTEASLRAFYDSWEWKRARYDFIKDKQRRCQCCGATPQTGTRIVVDHVKPIRLFWNLRLDPSNLQILCDDCNMGKGSRDQTDWR